MRDLALKIGVCTSYELDLESDVVWQRPECLGVSRVGDRWVSVCDGQRHFIDPQSGETLGVLELELTTFTSLGEAAVGFVLDENLVNHTYVINDDGEVVLELVAERIIVDDVALMEDGSVSIVSQSPNPFPGYNANEAPGVYRVFNLSREGEVRWQLPTNALVGGTEIHGLGNELIVAVRSEGDDFGLGVVGAPLEQSLALIHLDGCGTPSEQRVYYGRGAHSAKLSVLEDGELFIDVRTSDLLVLGSSISIGPGSAGGFTLRKATVAN